MGRDAASGGIKSCGGGGKDAWLEPMSVVGIEKAPVGPVAGRGEKGEHEERAIYTWPVEEIGGDEKHDDEGGGGRGGYEE